MKKVIVSILLIITIFNLIQPIISYASETEKNASNEYDELLNSDQRDIIINGSNEAKRKIGKGYINVTSTQGGVVANTLANIGSIIAFTISSAVAVFSETIPITIYDIVFGEIEMLNADYLLDSNNENDIYKRIREQVATWYYAIRNIAITLSLCVLIYVGIRMAISTLSEDKAKYKKMLIAWVQSFILIFFIHYIIVFSMAISRAILDIIAKIMPLSRLAEYNIYLTTIINAFTKFGWNAVPNAIMYWAIVYYEVKFFILYIKRMLSVAFLIIISPLITVTYPIDKVGDGKAQAFKAWFKEFEVNMFIQPLHALLYILFIISTSEILLRAPLFAIVFFMGLSRGEKVIKGLFNARGMKSIHSMGKGKRKK